MGSTSSSSSTGSLEAVLARARPRAGDLFRRYAISVEEAATFLLDALPRLESLQGAIPGAGHRLLKLLEAACRRARPQAPPPDPPVAADYRPAFERALDHLRRDREARDRRRAECAAVVTEIEARCTGGDGWRSSDSGPEPSRELVTAVLQRSHDLWKRSPQGSLALAEVALELIKRLPQGVIHDRLRADLEARAHALAGRAHRLLQDYRPADRAFVAAEAALARGTQDPRERASVLTMLATLRLDQRRFPESLGHYGQAAAIYRWTHERHLEGRTYSLMAIAHAYAGEPELAIPLVERAADLIDPERDPLLAATLEHNMTHFLCAAGRAEDARQRLPRARRLMRELGNESDLRGLRWIEGQIAFALGEAEEGERLLLGVREEFVAAGNLYDTALVSLELAAAYLDRRRTGDAKRLAEETLPIFQSLEVHREALAALIAVQKAIELETATSELVRELLATLQRARNGPPPRPEQPS